MSGPVLSVAARTPRGPSGEANLAPEDDPGVWRAQGAVAQALPDLQRALSAFEGGETPAAEGDEIELRVRGFFVAARRVVQHNRGQPRPSWDVVLIEIDGADAERIPDLGAAARAYLERLSARVAASNWALHMAMGAIYMDPDLSRLKATLEEAAERKPETTPAEEDPQTPQSQEAGPPRKRREIPRWLLAAFGGFLLGGALVAALRPGPQVAPAPQAPPPAVVAQAEPAPPPPAPPPEPERRREQNLGAFIRETMQIDAARPPLAEEICPDPRPAPAPSFVVSCGLQEGADLDVLVEGAPEGAALLARSGDLPAAALYPEAPEALRALLGPPRYTLAVACAHRRKVAATLTSFSRLAAHAQASSGGAPPPPEGAMARAMCRLTATLRPSSEAPPECAPFELAIELAPAEADPQERFWVSDDEWRRLEEIRRIATAANDALLDMNPDARGLIGDSKAQLQRLASGAPPAALDVRPQRASGRYVNQCFSLMRAQLVDLHRMSREPLP